jgi:hypothetical protein
MAVAKQITDVTIAVVLLMLPNNILPGTVTSVGHKKTPEQVEGLHTKIQTKITYRSKRFHRTKT